MVNKFIVNLGLIIYITKISKNAHRALNHRIFLYVPFFATM